METIYAGFTSPSRTSFVTWQTIEGCRVVTQHPDLGFHDWTLAELEAVDELLHEYAVDHELPEDLRSGAKKLCDARDERYIGADFWFAKRTGTFDPPDGAA